LCIAYEIFAADGFSVYN